MTHEGQKQLKHEVFKSVLKSGEIVRVKNVTINSEKHELMTLEQNKVAVSAYCDKRFYLDPINSLPFGHIGHKNIREFAFHNVILNDWDWESENESDLDSISQPTPENVISKNSSSSPPDPFIFILRYDFGQKKRNFLHILK